MKALGGYPAFLALTALGIGLSACGSSGPAKVSVDKLKQAADKAVAAPATATSCPLGLDVDAALKKAGVGLTATPGGKGAKVIPAVEADDSGDDEALQKQDGAAITCNYTLSTGDRLWINVVGVHTGSAFVPMQPRLDIDGDLGASGRQFVAQKFDTGKAVVTPLDGTAAVVKLAGDGGDVVLEAASHKVGGEGYIGPITGEKLRMLTETLGKQVHL